jgi:selenocysteine lyase/cysteine desulfurase
MLTPGGFEALRQREFARLDEQHEVYLDYTGTGLAPTSLMEAHRVVLERGVFGNPHSSHAASRRSTALLDDARDAVLTFFGVDTSTHTVCFTANATAAAKLVAESYPFNDRHGLVLSADNHNSLNGIREYARRAGAPVCYAPLDGELRLEEPADLLRSKSAWNGALVAFPAQSNFSGVRHPLSLVDDAHVLGFDVLLDAAAFVPTCALDLGACAADFVVLSFYKMFGYPTGVGALIARKHALARLQRPWFAGGTVDFASVQNDQHALRSTHEGFEDGTPNFLAVSAIPSGLAFLRGLDLHAIATRVQTLTESLLLSLQSLRHSNGTPLITLYGPRDMRDRGGTIAFNVLDVDGATVPYEFVEQQLSDGDVFVRGGCFCNPGAAEAAFHFDREAMAQCLTTLAHSFTVERLAECLGPAVPVGAIRASIGVPTNPRDLARAISALARFRDCRTPHGRAIHLSSSHPIKLTQGRPTL